MRSYLTICLLAAALNVAYSAVSIQLAAEKPAEFADEEGCYSITLNRVLPFNQSYSPQDGESCTQYNCRSDGSITIFTCGVVAYPEGYTPPTPDLTLPYPYCCESASSDAVPLPDTLN